MPADVAPMRSEQAGHARRGVLHGLLVWRRAARQERAAGIARRGYSISLERLLLACAAEFFVIAASLYGNWLFARMYGHGDPVQMQMMMLAPIGYAVIELTRVPLALSARTQTSRWLRALALIGVVCAAGVTIKSMSQLGEIMFRPRLFDVTRAKEALGQAKDEQATLLKRIADADAAVAQRQATLGEASARTQDAARQLGSLPPQTCLPTSYVTRRGHRVTGVKCSAPDTARPAALSAALSAANVSLTEAQGAYDKARSERDGLDRRAVDGRVSDATLRFREAVMQSQLHSFTAMLFGIDPTEVTDAELHQFLRVFVFAPAVFVAFASAMLAYTSVTRIKPEVDPVALDDAAGEYILDPFAQRIVREAVDAADRRVEQALERARPPGLTAPPAANAAEPPAAPATVAQPASAPVVPFKRVGDAP